MVRNALVYCFVVFLVFGVIGSAAAEGYRLQAGDRVRVTVFAHPEASGELEVSNDGQVVVPLVGAVFAHHKTPEELARVLAQRLDAEYLVKPQVTVELLATAPFYILGQVKNPGSYTYR